MNPRPGNSPPINITDPIRIDPIMGRVIPCPTVWDCRPCPAVCQVFRPVVVVPSSGPIWTAPTVDEVVIESSGTVTTVQTSPVGSSTTPVAAKVADVEIAEIRLAEIGQGEQGPLVRILVRNNGKVNITKGFNVGVLVSTGRKMTADAPKALVRVESLKAGEEVAIELRLPNAAMNMGRNSDGQPVPFTFLCAVADSHEELNEKNTDNNVLVLPRSEIAMVEKR